MENEICGQKSVHLKLARWDLTHRTPFPYTKEVDEGYPPHSKRVKETVAVQDRVGINTE